MGDEAEYGSGARFKVTMNSDVEKIEPTDIENRNILPPGLRMTDRQYCSNACVTDGMHVWHPATYRSVQVPVGWLALQSGRFKRALEVLLGDGAATPCFQNRVFRHSRT